MKPLEEMSYQELAGLEKEIERDMMDRCAGLIILLEAVRACMEARINDEATKR